MKPESSLPRSRDPLDPTLSRMNEVHIRTPYSFQIYLNIVLSPTYASLAAYLLSMSRPSFCMRFSSPL
jgi:hypothetical protein